jgi:thiol-disulfide isomerase/thioredoxin
MLSALLTAALAAPLAAHAVSTGKPAPEFSLPGTERTIRLADYRGKFVYLDFWASWCGPCRQSFPWMNAMQEKYGKDGLVVVAVNVDIKRADADKFLAEQPARFTIAFDGTGATPKTYSIKAMPSSILIGPDGTVRFVHNGFREDQKDMMEARIREALRAAPRTAMLSWPLELRGLP